MLLKVLFVFGPDVFAQGRGIQVPQQKCGSKMGMVGDVEHAQITVMYSCWRGMGAPVCKQVCQNLVYIPSHPEALQTTEITSDQGMMSSTMVAVRRCPCLCLL